MSTRQPSGGDLTRQSTGGDSLRLSSGEQRAADEKCSFWFVRAENLRDPALTRGLPTYREMKIQHSKAMVKREISLFSGLQGAYATSTLFVSHRWEKKDQPDANAKQQKELQAYLRQKENQHIKFVWFDFWCLPQPGKDGRSKAEQKEFDRMMPNIALLCLSCSVLILLDPQPPRFWGAFEAWCAMQRASLKGLLPDESRSRLSFVHLQKAGRREEEQLVERWATLSVFAAHEALAGDDMRATNQRDRDVQLPRMLQVDERVRSLWATLMPVSKLAIDDQVALLSSANEEKKEAAALCLAPAMTAAPCLTTTSSSCRTTSSTSSPAPRSRCCRWAGRRSRRRRRLTW